MIKLNQTASQYLQLITGQNGAVVDVSYSDKSSSDFLGDSQLTSIVTATTTTICDTPAASVVRYIDFISITNTFAGNHTITVQQNSSATAYPIVKDLIMSSGDRLEYTHACGWRVVDSMGAIHTVVASPQVSIAAGKTFTVSNSLTLAGTDGTTQTFPSTSATIARIDAAQTFTGIQTFSSSPIIPEATAVTHALQASQKPGFPINFNGNFQVAHAGTSFAAPVSGAYDIDGWLNGNSSAAVFTVAQVAGSVAGKYARQVTITTADASVAAGDAVEDENRVEGYDIAKLVGKDFTVSFSAKFPVTGIHCIVLKNSGIDRTYVHEINCLVANTWAEYSFTVTGGFPTTGTWNYTNGIGIRAQFIHMAGTNYTSTPATADTWMTGNYKTTANQVNDCATIGNVWALEDFRIDLGTVKGTEWHDYQDNYEQCKRYYRILPVSIASNTDNPVTIPISMKDTPTITGGGAGFTSTGTTKDALICYQTTRATATITLASRL